MALSPMMQQYMDIRERYPDSILFFRLGDFYEMFFEQAELCSRELDLTLTGKECGLEERAPMCGIPFHSADIYIAKLVEKGYKVAICEQIEDASQAKGLVKRDIVKIVTPGTITSNDLLDEKQNNYIANMYVIGRTYALSYADISTGECFVTSSEDLNAPYKLIDEVLKLKPKELVLEDNMLSDRYIIENVIKRDKIYVSRYTNQDEQTVQDLNVIKEKINIAEHKSIVLLLNYIFETQKNSVAQINNVIRYDIEGSMRLDINTRRNLEITESNREKTKKGSLLWVLDKTVTAMGARKLRTWVENPLLNKKEIDERLESVEILVNNMFVKDELIELLRNVRDTKRIVTKLTNGNCNGRDLICLKNSFAVFPNIKKALKELVQKNSEQKVKLLRKLEENIDSLEDIFNIIENAIEEEPPLVIKEGGIIKKGYNEEVDALRMASKDGKNWIMTLEAKEREETGIKGLKIGYNRVFGYYIEITKSNYKDIPEGRYIRKQTLADKERFITPELKEIEDKILGSEDKLVDLEYKLFTQIRERISREVVRIQTTADAIAILDTLCSFATVAQDNNYVKPNITLDDKLEIIEGRHPVVEKNANVIFIPNSTYLNCEGNRFHIITGPNMAGKSTYMRQVALITYMAQIGSFVPAKQASIGIVDRIFTRVGASDDLASGESTFMVEMSELANILENATSKSLVILDEIGRGTSTYDGMAIAWATVEHIVNKEKLGAKTLFATHYHELTDLEQEIEGIKNFSVEVKEKGDDVIFLRKIIEGPADGSYGIYVARLAGISNNIVNRAKAILNKLEEESTVKNAKKNTTQVITNSMQVDMFNYKLAEVGRILDKMSLDELTAKEALDTLYKLKEKIQ
ncbi:MAG: DNA mismatch repair protein MutS [Clostridia bacterium]|nr:DNA mismatch repair protein MutS [Clostridia bacterium]